MIGTLSTTNIDLKKYPVFSNIENNLKRFDTNLQTKKFDNILSNFDSNINLCEKLKSIAIKKNDEYCANITFILKINFSLIKSIALFWKLCEDFEYQQAWSYLQDVLDQCKTLLKFCDKETTEYLITIYEYFSLIEELFPYHVFSSSAFHGIETICSICGKSPFDPGCCHINGNLYWGEMATNVVINIKSVNHVALVPNPDDKRCIINMGCDKNTPQNSPFKKVYLFIKYSGRPLRNFKIKKSEREIQQSELTHVIKEWPCPCGSGIPFQECCYDKETIKIPHIDLFFDNE